MVFGVIDFIIQEPIFFKFEAAIINILFALFFGFSLYRSKPIVQEIAEHQGRVDSVDSADKTFFFRFLTYTWVIYFVVKAIVLTWINLNHSLNQSLLLRVLIGNGSFALMILASIGLAEPLWNLMTRLRWLPSARSNKLPADQ